jgi:GNAT superfamily N-acetyltransferase
VSDGEREALRSRAARGDASAADPEPRWATVEDLAADLEARHPGLSLGSSGPVVLSKIVLPKDQRGAGLGSAVMSDILAEADRHGWAVALTPSADFGGSKTRLVAFYRRFGFVPNSGRHKDWSTRESMIRPAAAQ